MRVLFRLLAVASIVLAPTMASSSSWLLQPEVHASLHVKHFTHSATAFRQIHPRTAQKMQRAPSTVTVYTLVAASGVSHLRIGHRTSQPIGHRDFCRRRPRECSITSADTTLIRLTDTIWRRIQAVNSAVNNSVEPKNDRDIYGKEEVWTYPDKGVGDCEDFVLEKQRRLNRAGIPLSSLLITVVRKHDGEGHAVLTVRTDRGDLILDNLEADVKPVTATDYSYLKAQDPHHTGRWRTINRSSATPSSVSAIRMP